MKAIKLYETFLTEGGWATTKTQGTVLTPAVIAEVVKVMDRITTGFNGHLRELELPSLDILKPIGSGTWWREDVTDQPDKTYGDVDYMVAYPTLKLTAGRDREDEIATVKLYNAELLMWLEEERIPDVDVPETRAISSDVSVKLVVVVPFNGAKAYVQVDMVVTHKEYSDWAVFRMTPIRNVKGFVLGNLYSSFGEVLDLSIQARGVRAKFEGEVMKPYSKRANVEDRIISQNAETFMTDIARFFWEQSGTDIPFTATPIETWKGMNPKAPQFEDLATGIRLVAKTLGQLDEFGTTIKYKSEGDLLKAVVAQYTKKMMEAYNSAKFDKAETPAAKAVVTKVRATIDEYISLANQLLA